MEIFPYICVNSGKISVEALKWAVFPYFTHSDANLRNFGFKFESTASCNSNIWSLVPTFAFSIFLVWMCYFIFNIQSILNWEEGYKEKEKSLEQDNF